jgi:steroid Delta-isomerase
MNAGAEEATRHIYEQRHETLVRRDIRGLMEPYAEDAILESPLIHAAQQELGSGILRGKSAIGEFFAAASHSPSKGLGRRYRTGHFFANGRQLTWEYPRATPDGDQIDLVEVIDVSGGLITRHRVYWGWVGFRMLSKKEPVMKGFLPSPDHLRAHCGAIFERVAPAAATHVGGIVKRI